MTRATIAAACALLAASLLGAAPAPAAAGPATDESAPPEPEAHPEPDRAGPGQACAIRLFGPRPGLAIRGLREALPPDPFRLVRFRCTRCAARAAGASVERGEPDRATDGTLDPARILGTWVLDAEATSMIFEVAFRRGLEDSIEGFRSGKRHRADEVFEDRRDKKDAKRRGKHAKEPFGNKFRKRNNLDFELLFSQRITGEAIALARERGRVSLTLEPGGGYEATITAHQSSPEASGETPDRASGDNASDQPEPETTAGHWRIEKKTARLCGGDLDGAILFPGKDRLYLIPADIEPDSDLSLVFRPVQREADDEP